MIYTVTLNPSIDRTITVPEFNIGEINRAQIVRIDSGGKGINVSRALQKLKITSHVIGFAGGYSGDYLLKELVSFGFETSFVTVKNETRQNITLVDESRNLCMKINEPGSMVDPCQLDELLQIMAQRLRAGDHWVFSGSLPPGIPTNQYARLIAFVNEKKGLAFLDTNGIPLREGIDACPYAVKVNQKEISEVLNKDLCDAKDLIWASEQLLNKGIQLVLLTMGEHGACLAKDGKYYFATPPYVATGSSVGAGDATLAGLLWAIQDNCDPVKTLQRALACGISAAMQLGTGLGENTEINNLVEKVQVFEY